MKNYVGTTTDSGYKLDVNGTGRNPEIKNYLGQKCKGFRFPDGVDGVKWNEKMNKYIGEIGEIIDQRFNNITIEFGDDYWLYPISLIDEQLVNNIIEIKQNAGAQLTDPELAVRWYNRLSSDEKFKVVQDFLSGFNPEKLSDNEKYWVWKKNQKL
jgi:hypothetical protein